MIFLKVFGTTYAMAFNFATLVAVIIPIAYVKGYPNGGPITSCIHAFPKHNGLLPQTTPNPYVIDINGTSYGANDIFEVVLRSPVNWPFRGFQIRAHRVSGDQEELVGDFIGYPASAKPLFWFPSHQSLDNCVTHKDNTDKKEIRLMWRAPNITVGNIYFTATFLKNYEEFWINVKSIELKSRIAVNALEDYPGKIQKEFETINYDEECGKSRGCFLYPRSCFGSKDCKFAVSYSHQPGTDYVDFEMMGIATGYISLGFSKDRLMGEDSTVSCIVQDSYYSVQNGFNPFKYNSQQRITGITKIAAKREGNKIHCSFRRPLSMNATVFITPEDGSRPFTKSVPFDLRQDYYLSFAWGYVYKDTTVIGHHKQLPLVSTEKINVATKVIYYGQAIHVNLKIHGTLALVAWMFFAGLATVLARYFRQSMSVKCCEAAVWFQLHRASAILVALCTAAAIIVIFVYLKAWTKYAVIHAVLGLVVMGLVLFQIMLGLCRPDPSSKRRGIFNWTHRITGQIVHILAAVTLILAFQSPLFEENVRMIETIIIAVWIAVQIAWELLFELYSCYIKGRTEKDMNVKSNDNEVNAKNTTLMVAYFLYNISLAVLLFAAIYFLFIS